MPVRIVEWQLPYTWGTGIEIDANKVISLLLREENNLILVNDDNEIYTDLQLASWLTPQSDFPVWVTTGKVLEADGRPQSWLMLNWKTTSWDYARWIYCADGEIYFDGGNWVWRKVYYSSEVDALLQQLRNYVDLNFQPKLTAWAGITIDANNVISAQGAGTWDVSWPNGAVNGHLAVFDGTTGKAIKDWWPVPTQVTVVDALDSTSTTSALSANQWKVLDDKISTLAGLGKFLSLWDCTTGQPISFPYSTPYAYTTWDYFIIEAVSSATPPVNYKPDGSSYTGSASSVTESDEVEVWDVYVYDGTVWLLQSNHWKTVSFWNIAGQPSDNANLNNVLNSKQPKVIDVTVTTGASTATKVGTTTGGSYTPTSWDLLLVNFVNGCRVDNPTLNIDGSWAKNINIGLNNAEIKTLDLWVTPSSNVKILLYYNGTYYQAWSTENDTYSNMSVSEWKTGTSISTRVITASNLKEIIKYHAVDDTAFGASWDWVTDMAPSKNAVYDKINAMDTTIAWKQNTLIAWANIQIDSVTNTISATGSTYTAWEWIEIRNWWDYSAMQWPCPTWFHVPLPSDWENVISAWIALGRWTATNGDGMSTDLKLPYAWELYFDDWQRADNGEWVYWSCQPYSEPQWYALYASITSNLVSSQYECARSEWGSVRPFKDNPVVPDSNWTTIYQGTWSAWIFHNATDGLISISSDWVTWYTIADKNLWATVVYNWWDAMSESNCGWFFQWGNNYMFPFTWATTVSSTLVDASAYWPWNYYSSSTFIRGITLWEWDSPENLNLWWYVTWATIYNNAITNTWVLVSDQPNNILTSWMKIWAGTETNYWNLGTYDSNCLYLTIE